MSVFRRIRGRDAAGNPLRDDCYTIKIQWQGKQKPIATGCTTEKDALKLQAEIKRELKAGRIPELLGQLRSRADLTTSHIIDDYIAARCPDRRLRDRAGDTLAHEAASLAWCKQWWGAKKPADIKATDCGSYLAWRKTKISAHYSGKRTVELELQSLANCFNWALAAGKIEKRPELMLRFRDPKDIRHARTRMPACGDEVHAIATRFFTPQRGCHDPGCTEVYGWLALWLPLTGMRIGEAVQLLANPKPIGVDLPAGYADEKRMRIAREKRGCNPWIRLDDPQRPHVLPLLEMIRAWHAAQHPNSPWLFPAANGGQLDTKPLTKAMARACKNLGLEHRTAHGYRAYYASTRLAQGIDVEDVARELGQRSGEDLVRDVYGLELDDFQAETFRALAGVLTWLPNSAGKSAAWDWWTNQKSNIISLAAG